MGGDAVSVDLGKMGITINGTERTHPPAMLHDSPFMTSDYGSGVITITTSAETATFKSSAAN